MVRRLHQTRQRRQCGVAVVAGGCKPVDVRRVTSRHVVTHRQVRMRGSQAGPHGAIERIGCHSWSDSWINVWRERRAGSLDHTEHGKGHWFSLRAASVLMPHDESPRRASPIPGAEGIKKGNRATPGTGTCHFFKRCTGADPGFARERSMLFCVRSDRWRLAVYMARSACVSRASASVPSAGKQAVPMLASS